MPKPAAQVTAAEIARLAGVTRATVSNWRRRHADFPAPSGGTETSPTYDLEAVRAWLAARGQLPAATAADELRVALRVRPLDDHAPGRLLALVLAADRLGAGETKRLLETPDDHLPRRVADIVRPYVDKIPGVNDATYRPEETHLLRTLLRCVREDGALRAADVLAERDREDTAAGAYETTEPLADLMADLLASANGAYPARVFDPACGTGGLLAAAARRGSGELYGQDVLVTRAAQATVRLGVLAPKATVHVGTGDSLRADAFPALAADAALCAPPYGDRDWGHEELAYDPRWLHGLPPKGEPELAWAQHCLAHVTEGAPVVLLMPPATAERAAGRRIRADLVRTGTLRAVIALPAGAAAPLHVGLHLWLLRRPDPRSPAPQTVLFVDTVDPDQRTATAASRPGLDWAAMRETVNRAWSAYRADGDGFEAVPGTARAVPAIDLLDGAVDLTPARHVRVTPVPVRPDQYARTAQQIRTRLHRATTELAALSDGTGWPSTGGEPRTWRSTTVADLLRGGALTLLRSPTSGRGAAREPRGTVADPTPTLTVEDIAARRPASGPPDETGEAIEIREGDVILPELLRSGPRTARVADADDAGHRLGPGLYLLRPDPQRLDPWFLAGFLSDEDNVNAAATGASIVRVNARRLRVPLLPLAEQQRYGEAFRQLHTLRVAADNAHRLAEETVRVLGSGLTGGVLMPPVTHPQI